MEASSQLRKRDYLLLAAYGLLLFGIATVSGRPLTLHESVLPQSAREMFADGDLLVPKKGGEPWLESPPLPQWITVAIATAFGRCDTESIVRLGPMFAGVVIICLVAWMASVWFGRGIGLLAGFVQATTFQFTRYAWLAEDEIFLCALVTAAIALFVRLEFGQPTERLEGRGALSLAFGRRSWWMVAFFAALGATNLAKGLIFGPAMAGIPMAGYLLLSREPARLRKYFWIWGGLLFALIMFAWPAAVLQRFPDAVDVWFKDLGGRLSGEYTLINQPWWYYPVNLLWMIAPWTFVAPWMIRATWRSAWSQGASPERFLWGWALLVPAVFSIPGGKHHHYLLHAMAPWAILAALGIRRLKAEIPGWPLFFRHPASSLLSIATPAVVALLLLRDRIAGPAWLPWVLLPVIPVLVFALAFGFVDRRPWRSGAIIFGGLWLAYSFGHVYSGQYFDRHRYDAAFLKSVRVRSAESGLPLLVDMGGRRPLQAFLKLFYQGDSARPLHNVSFLADRDIAEPEILVLTQAGEEAALRGFGDVELLSQSESTSGDVDGTERLSLYRLTYRADLERLAADHIEISPAQAIQYAPRPQLTRRF